MAKFAGLRDPVTLDFENSTIAYCVDAFSISMGALIGTSPVTAFIESATGIAGMWHYLWYLSLLKHTCRGWEDWHYCGGGWPSFLCVRLLRTYICLHPLLGYGRCSRHCRLPYDP